MFPDADAEIIIKNLLEPAALPVQEAPKVPVVEVAAVAAETVVSPEVSVSNTSVSESPAKEQNNITPAVSTESSHEVKEIVQKKHFHVPSVQKEEIPEPVSKPVDNSKIVLVDSGDVFLTRVRSFFDKHNISIHELTTIKKKTEFDITIEIPSPLGGLVYFCKAKNSKRISNSDLSSAYVQGQLKKLPVVFLSPGELAKPAKIFMKDLKGLTVSRL